MFRGNHLQVAGKAAILATLFCGSSIAFAQVAAPVAVQPTVAPVQQAPAPVATPQAAPTVQPPAVVRTVPDAEPVAQAEAERPAPRRRAAAAPAARVTSRAEVAPAAPSVEPVVINEPTAVIDPLPVEESGAIATPVEDSAVVAPVAQSATEPSGMTTEDWTLAGGIAAVLAALGLGALATRRRRRAVNDNDVQPVAMPVAAPITPRPMMAPIKDDPIFKHPAPSPAEDRLIQRAPVITRPDVPVTDPLFSHKPVAAPITDPMFAPKREVEPPITDPMFAHHDRFVGRGTQGQTRQPELMN